MELGAVLDAVADMRAAHEKLRSHTLDRLTHPELLTLLSELESFSRQLPTTQHDVLARLQRDASPTELGAKSLRDVLTTRLRISTGEATRRLSEARDLGRRVALSGEPQEPVLAKVAAAQERGLIGPEHVSVIRQFVRDLPAGVDVVTREQCEDSLVTIARGHGPSVVKKDAELLLGLLDEDGPLPNDAERARKRFVKIGAQQADGMSPVTGLIDPELRATLEPIFAKLAAPGMCNPSDEHPRTSGTPSQEQRDADLRTKGQRLHDALTTIGRMALCSGELGQLNGLPVTVIVSTTLQDLESAAGCGVTGGGTRLPMRDLIRMGSHAHHYLAVYDRHTSEELYLGRSKRFASVGQRLMLFNRDLGCTKPGCDASAYETQVHHVNGWVASRGLTNITDMTLACGGDNRLADEGWTVRVRNGVAEWTPPPELDVGQPRVNYHHHPERLLAPDEVNDGEADDGDDGMANDQPGLGRAS